MLVEVTKNNVSNFIALAPRRERLRLERDENYFAIGYTDDESSYPDGILMFHPEKEEDEDGEVHAVAVISYFYVRESARDMYVGTYLFSNLLELADDTGLEAIRCDVPMDFEYNLLCNVLENFGFHFDITEVFEFETTLHKLTEIPSINKAPAKKTDLICELKQKIFALGLGKLVREEEFIEYGLSYDIEAYDSEVSTAVVENGVPKGLFLVKEDEDGCIMPLLLRSTEKSGVILSSLIREAMREAVYKYRPFTTVRFKLHSDNSLQMLKSLIPDFTPYIVRRGYFYI